MKTEHQFFQSIEERDEDIFTIPVWRLEDFNKKLAKLQRRASKLQDTQIKVEELGREYVKVAKHSGVIGVERNGYGEPRLELVHLRVTGEAPKLPGDWKPVAVIEPVKGSDKNLIFQLDEEYEINAADYLHTPMTRCDHCNKKITNRKKLVLMADKNDNLKVVGLRCILDFTGHITPEFLAKLHSLWLSLEMLKGSESDPDQWGRGARMPLEVPLNEILALTVVLVRLEGWKSAKHSGYSSSTGADIREYCFPPSFSGPYAEEGRAKYRAWRKRIDDNRKDEDWETAQAAKEWAMTAAAENPGNDFFQNLQVLAEVSWIDYKKFGLAAAMVGVHTNAIKKMREQAEIDKELREQRKHSDWIGEIKKRQDFTLTLLSRIYRDSDYGGYYITKWVDEDQNAVVWFASSNPGIEVRDEYDYPTFSQCEEGQSYKLKATPVEHGEFKGVKQTKINRAKIIEEVA